MPEITKHDIELSFALDIGLQILDLEEFELHLSIDEAVNKKSFFLKDMQSGNLGGIERETFFKLSAIIDRLDIYHDDYLYFAYEKRRCTEPKEEILEGDWDSAILYLLSNNKFTELLEQITPNNYEKLVEVRKEIGNNLPFGYRTAISYLTYKFIAESIIETQSAYFLVEQNNKIYLSSYGEFESLKEFTEVIKPENDSKELYSVFSNFEEIIDVNQIINDVTDLGLENHYLNEYAFCYLGLNKVYDRELENEISIAKGNTKLDFLDDAEKMRDFSTLTKAEFLMSYSYLTEVEYEATRVLFEQGKILNEKDEHDFDY